MTMLAPTVPDAETRSERRDAALWVRMNRPGDDNRITPVMVHEINDALDRAENDSEIRAFVLSAEAPVFCLGCDHYELRTRSEEHTSEIQSLMRISYAGACLKKKKYK